MSGSKARAGVAAVKRASNNPQGRPATLAGTERWMMRVDPEFHALVVAKAKDWGVSAAELVRLVVDLGVTRDLLEPPKPGEQLRDRLRRSRRR